MMMILVAQSSDVSPSGSIPYCIRRHVVVVAVATVAAADAQQHFLRMYYQNWRIDEEVEVMAEAEFCCARLLHCWAKGADGVVAVACSGY
jgi:hypothetical protein